MASMQKPSRPCNGPRTPPEHQAQGLHLSASSGLEPFVDGDQKWRSMLTTDL